MARVDLHRCCVAAALALLTSTTSASGFSARNLAMGGAGVASSHYDAASRANPALLTDFREGDRFAVSLPVATGEVSDPDDVVDGLDAISTRYGLLEQQVIAGDVEGALQSRDAILGSLEAIADSPVLASLGAGLSFAVPGKRLAFAIDLRSRAEGGAVARYDPADAARINGAIASGDPGALDDIQSYGLVLGAAVSEFVLSLATSWQLPAGEFALGFAPKYQRVDTALYVARANSFDSDDIDLGDIRDDGAAFNMDVGAAWDFAPHWRLGLMWRDLIANDYDTLEINGFQTTYRIEPNASLGVAYHSNAFTLALDGDLNSRSSFDGLDASQFVSLGGEFNAANWVQLRAGLRHDARNTRENIATLGIGFSPFDVFHVDLTGFFGRSDTFGGALELSLTL